MNDSFISDTGARAARISVTPDDVQIIVLKQILAELRDLNARVASGSGSEARSHVEVKTSARGVDVGVKIYEGSTTDGLSDTAVAEYFATMEKVQARLNAA